jgi:hypothetical protein
MPAVIKHGILGVQVADIVEREIWDSKGGSLSMDFNIASSEHDREAIGRSSHLPWFAVRVKSNYEKPVSAMSAAKASTSFCQHIAPGGNGPIGSRSSISPSFLAICSAG